MRGAVVKCGFKDTRRRDFKQLGGQIATKTNREARNAAYRIRDRARAEAPVGKMRYVDAQGGRHPGNLKRSIVVRRLGVGVYTVIVEAPYGKYVEYGTRPHVIRPRVGTFLRFKSQTGEWVFAKEVHHPGTAPNPFFHRSIRQVKQQLNLSVVVHRGR